MCGGGQSLPTATHSPHSVFQNDGLTVKSGPFYVKLEGPVMKGLVSVCLNDDEIQLDPSGFQEHSQHTVTHSPASETADVGSQMER